MLLQVKAVFRVSQAFFKLKGAKYWVLKKITKIGKVNYGRTSAKRIKKEYINGNLGV